MTLERLVWFCKSFFDIEWNRTTLTICLLPFVLIFMILHGLVIMMYEHHGAIVTDTRKCGIIGKDVLLEGGSAVDATIAIMFCESVYGPKMVGLGGGFTALIYDGGRMRSLIATPTTPAKAPIDKINDKENLRLAMLGGIPGELLGYWEMHRQYGLLSWKRLIEPSLNLCKKGVNIIEPQLRLNRRLKRYLKTNKYLYPDAVDGIIKCPVYAKTLLKISKHGADVFYKGEVGEAFVRDVQAQGGVLTMNDLMNYNVSWSWDTITFYLSQHMKVYTTPLPSSGVIVAAAMKVIKAWKDYSRPVFWHRVVEATKHALGSGLTLGDIENESNEEIVDYIKETYEQMSNVDNASYVRKLIHDDRILNDTELYGSSYQQSSIKTSVHVAVLATNGDAVSLTSSLLWSNDVPFYSRSTGIYWNDQLRSYQLLDELPPAGRRARPWKRPMAPHAPIIAFPTYQNRPVLILGATAGPHTPAQIITVLTKYGLMHKSINVAIDSGYLLPNINQKMVLHEDFVPSEVIDYLTKVGQNLSLFGARLRYFGIAAIGNRLSRPIPCILTRREGATLGVEPEHLVSKFELIIVFCMATVLLTFLVREYFHWQSKEF